MAARGKAITPKMRDEIEGLLNANVPHGEIADQYGLTLLTIKKISHLLNRLKKSRRNEMKSDYPAWICSDCGDKWGRRECGVSTWHEDECGVCGYVSLVTEPRDYGHLKDGWQKGKRNEDR